MDLQSTPFDDTENRNRIYQLRFPPGTVRFSRILQNTWGFFEICLLPTISTWQQITIVWNSTNIHQDSLGCSQIAFDSYGILTRCKTLFYKSGGKLSYFYCIDLKRTLSTRPPTLCIDSSTATCATFTWRVSNRWRDVDWKHRRWFWPAALKHHCVAWHLSCPISPRNSTSDCTVNSSSVALAFIGRRASSLPIIQLLYKYCYHSVSLYLYRSSDNLLEVGFELIWL